MKNISLLCAVVLLLTACQTLDYAKGRGQSIFNGQANRAGSGLGN